MDILNGSVLTDAGIIKGYVCIEGGKVTAIEEGRVPKAPIATGLIVAPMVNAHSHCGDRGLRGKIPEGVSLEELVGPPNGLKHRHLREISEQDLRKNIKEYAEASRGSGIGTFIDFREGGVKGCSVLRDAAPEATIMGRPVSKEYDPEEISKILDIADGIGISGIADMDHSYIENVADQVRERGKMFSIHASENRREDIDLILSFDPAFVVHMVHATDSDILKCAETDVPIVVCARSNSFFRLIPPIKRMMDCGVDIAIGTDNAMLCDPDMRSEASAFRDVLLKQGGSEEDIIAPMLTNGRKLLYPNNKIYVTAGMTADLTVLPYAGEFRINGILTCKDSIFRYGPEKRR